MKSKKLSIAAGFIVIFTLITWFTIRSHSPYSSALTVQWLENTFPKNVDEEGSIWNILPYGYSLGPWPDSFQGEPIVTKLTYLKGPPQKFIQNLIQIWKPVEIELTLEGPKTIEIGMGADRWKECFSLSNSCMDEKRKFHEYASGHFPRGLNEGTYTWFDSLDPIAARGVHTHIEAATYSIDRFTVLTPLGVAQNFTLKYVKNKTGQEAYALFVKIVGGLKVKDELVSSREWIQGKIKTINLAQVQSITDYRLRFKKLIQIQNYIFSHLSVDPTQVAPFFHLAGVTHLLAMDLLRTDQKYFDGQEAWILSVKPLLETLILYAKDFEKSETEVKNMEALLQDVLLLQQKMSGSK